MQAFFQELKDVLVMSYAETRGDLMDDEKNDVQMQDAADPHVLTLPYGD